MGKIFLTMMLSLAMGSHISSALADVYGYIGEDGVIALADTPVNDEYELLLTAPVEPIKAVEVLQPQVSDNKIQYVSTKNLHFHDEVDQAAKTNGVDSALLHAVITAESNYNPKAISVKGATGLMQLMPQTARRFGVTNIFDPKQNIQGGARYLAYLLDMFNNNSMLAVAAYNAGENAVIRHGNKVPPYRETIDYVGKVMKRYNSLR